MWKQQKVQLLKLPRHPFCSAPPAAVAAVVVAGPGLVAVPGAEGEAEAEERLLVEVCFEHEAAWAVAAARAEEVARKGGRAKTPLHSVLPGAQPCCWRQKW